MTAGGAAARRLARSGASTLVRRCLPVSPDAASAVADCQLPSRSVALISSFSKSSSRVAPVGGPSSFPAAGVSVGRSSFSSSASQTPSPHSSPPPPVPPPPPPQYRENPPDATNPDPVTLQEQWRYASRMYSKWYAHAWGTAILAGLSFYALGWFIKGENPLLFATSEKKEEAVLKAD